MKETSIHSGHPQIDSLFPRIRKFVAHNATDYNMFGRPVRGYRVPDTPSIWIRDNSDMMRAYKYWEPDITSMIDHFAEMQSGSGWFFDYFTMTPEKVPCERENWAKYVRVPVEADVEYRFIKAVYQAWQATGDDAWLRQLMPRIEKALSYICTDPWRWDPGHKLVKRAFTIDTWDFDYTAGRHPWLNFQIDDHTFWGIMHGDISGYYEAFGNVSTLYSVIGNARRARYWRLFAETFRRRANRICFNGRFYTHQVHLVSVTIPGHDESRQLTLSNSMDINRGLATHTMATSIIREYQQRGKDLRAFAGWFSVDPPFPDGIFGDEKLVAGAYCNGGIMPLVGGELARAAFEHGFEEYAVEQLLKYESLTQNGESYLWYFPDGRHSTIETSTSPDASPSDAWGSSAMAYALIEGLAGVVDCSKLFRNVRLSPRWLAAGRDEAEVCCAYGASGAFIEYNFRHKSAAASMELDITGNAKIDLHLLLPEGKKAKRLSVNGKAVKFTNVKIERSPYLDASFAVKKKARITVHYT